MGMMGLMKRLARGLINSQTALSSAFDRCLPERFRVDGNHHFRSEFIGGFLARNQTVYDLGGGRSPFISKENKAKLGLRLFGLDIDGAELAGAPEGVYDGAVCADVCTYTGPADADLVICQSLLEHVRDTHRAFQCIAGLLKPGGTALIFVPSRNAVYARLNLLLPHGLKRRILYIVFPHTRRKTFPAYYSRCTPRDFRRMAHEHGLEVVSLQPYFLSSYFIFCFPLHLFWRLWILLYERLAGEQAAESFSMAARKPAGSRSTEGIGERTDSP